MLDHPHVSPDNRCTFTFTNGARCRMLLCTDHPSLCFYHLNKLRKEDAEPAIPSSTVTVRGQLNNRVAVRRAVRRLACAVEDGRIAPRKAGVMLGICNLLIRTARPSRRRPRRKPSA